MERWLSALNGAFAVFYPAWAFEELFRVVRDQRAVREYEEAGR